MSALERKKKPRAAARRQDARGRWALRVVAISVIAIAAAVIWYTNAFLTQSFTESTRGRAEVRLALYTGNILTELQRTSVVPLLLARDPSLSGALIAGDFSMTSQKLISAPFPLSVRPR